MNPAHEPFELPITIRPDDIDQLGHVNNVVYLRWVQEAAIAHWTSSASEQAQRELRWVVLRHEFDYLRAVKPDDEVVARTWVGSATRRCGNGSR